jgi:hypothetical protein
VKRFIRSLAALIVLVCPMGCLTKQFTHDGLALHEAVVNMYTEQAMTNLIRAHDNVPFVQLNYYNVVANDKGFYRGAIGWDQTVNTLRDLFVAAATRSVTNTGTLGASGDNTRIMSFKADPVFNQTKIYGEYIAFANTPGYFAVSDRTPECPTYLMRKENHKYYWIPMEAGPEFQRLVLRTALMRGEDPPPAIPEAYKVKVLAATNVKKIDKAPHHFYNALLRLEPAIPNGDGFLLVDLKNGRRVKVALMPIDEVKTHEDTNVIRAQWPLDFEANEFEGHFGRVFSFDDPPETRKRK